MKLSIQVFFIFLSFLNDKKTFKFNKIKQLQQRIHSNLNQ